MCLRLIGGDVQQLLCMVIQGVLRYAGGCYRLLLMVFGPLMGGNWVSCLMISC